MPDFLVITPVKDSISTTLETATAIHQAEGDKLYQVYNDFSSTENKALLESKKNNLGFQLINLDEITQNPSPNYKLVLRMSQQKALELNIPLIIVESDVIVPKNTLTELLRRSQSLTRCGMIGAVTTDEDGVVNFPYLHFKHEKVNLIKTNHSLSFCCTLLTVDFLKQISFEELSAQKDWYDVFISKLSRQLGFFNYLATDLPVLHKPHSSRPWKMLKYTNPLKYYFLKFIGRKDRI